MITIGKEITTLFFLEMKDKKKKTTFTYIQLWLYRMAPSMTKKSIFFKLNIHIQVSETITNISMMCKMNLQEDTEILSRYRSNQVKIYANVHHPKNRKTSSEIVGPGCWRHEGDVSHSLDGNLLWRTVCSGGEWSKRPKPTPGCRAYLIAKVSKV